MGERQKDGYGDAMPARGYHGVEREIADGIQIALCARGEEILLESSLQQLERRVEMVIEQIPADVLAGIKRPCGTQARGQQERRAEMRSSHAPSACGVGYARPTPAGRPRCPLHGTGP